MSAPEASWMAPAPVPADVGLVMALPIEAGYLCDRLARVRKYKARRVTVIEGELAGKLVAVVISGAGRIAATRASELLVAGHRPRWLISAGFAGALDPTMARNQLVLPDIIQHAEGHEIQVEPIDASLPAAFHRGGKLLSVDQVVFSAAEKAALRASTGADLVDMESAAVALLAQERALRFLSLRVVSDDAATELPPEVARILSHSTGYQLGVAARAIWQRPSVLKDFWKLHGQAQESADRLADALRRVLAVLPAG
jgi:adenosylhomocysteine nucleosidase